MAVVVDPPAGTGCSGGLGRIGIGIGDPWLVSLDLFLVTNPSLIALLATIVVPSLDGTRVAVVTRSLMFRSLAPSSRSVLPGFRPCGSAVVVLVPSPSKGSLLGLESEP